MDPVTVGAVLLAVASGASEALGGQLWAGVVSLVRRPVHGGNRPAGGRPADRSGEAELRALEAFPGARAKAVALAEALLARSGDDPAFGQALHEWWTRAERVRLNLGNVTNTINGGNQHGPVLQGRDFTDLTFGATSAPAARPNDPDADLVASETAGKVSNTVSGGVQFGPVLQGGRFINPTFVIKHAAPAPVALAQLPPLTAGFTGRGGELAQLTALLNPANGPAVVVSAVAGLPGVGKTALAVHAAHAARSSGWFPGGVLFVDLHGYEESLVQPGQALDALLRALGISGEHIPDGAEQRAGLYRSVLAQTAEPLLVVADNASAEAQVRPLLPGAGPHRLIVTSRHTLGGIGARLLDVTVLGPEASARLMDEVVRAGRPADDRIGGDPAAAGRLAAACGGLPLALQIVAALLAADPALTAAELAADMADEVRRLETLRYDDGTGVRAPSVAAAFELSYRNLDEEAARMFRLLPSDPGPDVSTEAAAELVGWPNRQTRSTIGRLIRAHLVEPAGVQGRWRMHDLLRLYGRQVSGITPDERELAVDRVLAWYLRNAQAADKHLRSVPGTSVPDEFNTRDEALAWLDAQRPNLVAAATLAARTGRDREAVLMPLALTDYLTLRRRFDDQLTVLLASRDTARRLDQRGNEAATLSNLGLALAEVRRFEEAISAHQEALTIWRQIGDRHGEGKAQNNLALVLADVRRFEEAISGYQDAAVIFRDSGDRRGEGMAIGNLGIALEEMRRFEEAISAHREAAAIYREIGDRHREGMALENLGNALSDVGRFDQAINALQDAAAIHREYGDRYGEGTALDNLSLTLQGAHRLEEAIRGHQDAAAIFRETGDRHAEGMAIGNLALALYKARRFDEALRARQDAAAIYRETGDRHRESVALRNMAGDQVWKPASEPI